MLSGIMAWANSWNEIIREILFEDETLKDLMLIPEDTSIIDFIDRYFIKAGYTNKLLSSERVRIVYSDMQPQETRSNKVTRNKMSFDIYVKIEDLHNTSDDRLQFRTTAIAERLLKLLTQERYLYGYRFWLVGDYDLGTRTIGYARYNITVGYMKTY